MGRVLIDVSCLDVDLLTICSHKFHGPKGISALYIRQGIKLESLLYGAQHEKGLRAGTENVLAIVGLGKAC
jgi:cysteine desulfurase